MSFSLTNKQIERFRDDGFVVVDKLVDEKAIAQLHTRFDRLFQGDFETGTRPDEVNWQEGESDPELTRQICNAWKSDRCVAATVLREDLGHALAQLGSWPGFSGRYIFINDVPRIRLQLHGAGDICAARL